MTVTVITIAILMVVFFRWKKILERTPNFAF